MAEVQRAPSELCGSSDAGSSVDVFPCAFLVGPSRPNRWTKQQPPILEDQEEIVLEEEAQEKAVAAIKVLIPGCSDDLIRDLLEQHDGDSDAVLELLLAADDADEVNVVLPSLSEPSPDKPDITAAAAGDLAHSHGCDIGPPEEASNTAPQAPTPVKFTESPQSDAQSVPSPRASPGASSSSSGYISIGKNVDSSSEQGWTVVTEQPTMPTKFVQKPEAPSWQPLLRSGGKDLTSSTLTHYDVQTDRLKAALAAAKPKTSPASASEQDMHGAGKGSGKGAPSRGGG